MHQPSTLYRRHRFPGEIISHAVWLYSRFLLSYRDVEELLAERGIAVSDETVRRWCTKFGQRFAETIEETSLQTQVRRFLAALAYRTTTTLEAGIEHPVFYTYAFVVDETGGTLGALDEHERIEAYREIAVDDLPALADALDGLADADPDLLTSRPGADLQLDPRIWSDWGVSAP